VIISYKKYYHKKRKTKNPPSKIQKKYRRRQIFSFPVKIRLHSQIIYGDSVETFDPYYRGYMKDILV